MIARTDDDPRSPGLADLRRLAIEASGEIINHDPAGRGSERPDS
jgi:hypothetical protein